MQLTAVPSKRFKKQYDRLKFSGNSKLTAKLDATIASLVNGQKLPIAARDHRLSGNLNEYFECHVEPDWLLIYRIYEDLLVLELFATGTHSELFD